MNRVAAIDIGTNSVRLLIISDDGAEVCRHMHITRLGQGVDKNGFLSATAMQRTLTVLEEYGRLIQEHCAGRLRVTATSAARDASNRDDFFQQVQTAVGQQPELLSGADEACLSFSGAIGGLPLTSRPRAGEQTLVFDIGGGSTEFALGVDEPRQFLSLDMGGVRMSERFLGSDPPTARELQAAQDAVSKLLEEVSRKIPVETATLWVGLAGTVTSIAALAAGLERYTPSVTHGFSLTSDQVEAAYVQLTRANLEARQRLLIERKRADVICGGAVVLRQIFRSFDLKQIVVSEQDILDGLAASVVA